MTAAVLKLELRVRLVKLLVPLNIEDIVVTAAVSKLERSRLVKLLAL